MDKEAGKIKFKENTDIDALFKYLIREKKFDLNCKDIIDLFFDILKTKKLDASQIDFFVNSRGHLTFRDGLTGLTSTESCHFMSKIGKFNPSEINRFFDLLKQSIAIREGSEKMSESNKWIRVSEKQASEGLEHWFKEKWVDVSRPKKDGKWQECGRGDTSKGKKPVCVPKYRANQLSDQERKNRVRQKRKKEKEPNPDKRPNKTTYTPSAGGKSHPKTHTKAMNMKFVKIAQEDFNYKNESLYRQLSKYGKEKVDAHNETNPITSWRELDEFVESVFKKSVDEGYKMFPSKAEKARINFEGRLDDRVIEYIYCLVLANNGLDQDKQYAEFANPSLLDSLRRSILTSRMVAGKEMLSGINPHSPHRKFYRKLAKQIGDEVTNSYDFIGADEKIDTALYFLTIAENKAELISEILSLYDSLATDEDSLRRLLESKNNSNIRFASNTLPLSEVLPKIEMPKFKKIN